MKGKLPWVLGAFCLFGIIVAAAWFFSSTTPLRPSKPVQSLPTAPPQVSSSIPTPPRHPDRNSGRCPQVNRVEDWEPDPFNFKEDAGLPSNLIHRLSQLASAELVDVLLPLVTNLIKENQIVESGDLSRNKIWPIITQNLHSDFKFQLLEGLREAMCQVAISDPDKLRKLTDGLELMSDRTITYLLLSAWAANGACFSDPIIEYLLQNPNRLNLGLDTWGTGNGIAAVSRAAVEAAAPTATAEKLAQLEALILFFHPPEEKKRPERFGLLEFLLLHSLGESRLSDAGRRRYQEVSRKFGEVISTAPPARAFRGGFVSSPIPESAPKRMSDRNWLEAMQTYESEDPERQMA